MIMATLFASAAMGDTFTTRGGVPYRNARVIEVKDAAVVFHFGSRTLTKPLAEIKLIELRGKKSFNAGEKFASEGKWLDAVKEYDKAIKKTKVTWRKRMLGVRRLRALAEAKMFAPAVRQWLALADEEQLSSAVLALRPAGFAAKGSKANKRAIDLLKQKHDKLKARTPYSKAVASFLMEIYSYEGMSKAAAALAGEAAGDDSGTGANTGTPSTGSDVRGRFVRVKILIESGQASKALASIEAGLKSYKLSDLPAALLWRGRAQMALAEKASGSQREALLLKAGLNFMRAFSALPDSSAAGEALFEAGRMHTKLARPNTQAARSAFEAVIRRYGDAPVARRAQQALAKLGAE